MVMLHLCIYNYNSLLLTDFLVPTPDIIFSNTSALYNVGTPLNLSCKIILMRENIDVNMVATIKLYNKDILNETRMIPVVTEGENLVSFVHFHFSNIKSSDSGIYKCEGIVDDDINSLFIVPSDVVVDYVTVNVKSECCIMIIMSNEYLIVVVYTPIISTYS